MTRVVFFGNERLVSGLEHTDAPILQGLIDKGYDVVGVISHHTETVSRKGRPLEVAEIAKQHDIPLFLPSKPTEIIDEIRSLKADVAVLAAYGRIVSQEVIDLFPLGIINIHPSLLPKYRGPTPIESAILNGDVTTGVSIMLLTAGMDEGPVFGQTELSIEKDEEKFHLYLRIVDAATALFFDVFPKIVSNTLQPTPQNNDNATYSKLIKKDDGKIDWNKPAKKLVAEIRAYAGWPQSRTKIGDIDVIITKAHAVSNDNTGATVGKPIIIDNHTLAITASDGDVYIDSLKPLGKKEMPVQAFLSGYKSKF